MTLIAILVILLVVVIILGSALFTVRTQTNYLVQRFGKFVRVAHPGLNIKIPLIDQKVGPVSLRVQQLDMTIETKTKDNIFTRVVVSVQFFVPPSDDAVERAYYRLSNPEAQITSYVYDSVRAMVPTLTLDDAFERKNDIADRINTDLSNEMEEFGYKIQRALVVDIDPDASVKAAMNNINVSQRNKTAAEYQGDADKITVVKQAEAQAESKRLQGEGIAAQRKAIAEGLRASVGALKEMDVTDDQVMRVLLATQYFDTISDARAQGATTIFLPGGADGVGQIDKQLLTSLIGAGDAGKAKDLNPGSPQRDRARRSSDARAPQAGPQAPASPRSGTLRPVEPLRPEKR
jgi:regulator of protease activity HflC (stomatin/prohibitin superfamily)